MVDQLRADGGCWTPAQVTTRTAVTGSGQTGAPAAASERTERGRDTQETAVNMETFRGQERVADRAAMPELPTADSGWGSTGWGQKALDGAYAEFNKLLKELEGLGSSPESLAKSSILQFKMQAIQQVIGAVTKIREMVHESIMRTFR
jgi:hypothetical protein